MANNTSTKRRVTFAEPTTTSSITVEGVITNYDYEIVEPLRRCRRYTDRGGLRPSRPVEGGNPFDDATGGADASPALPDAPCARLLPPTPCVVPDTVPHEDLLPKTTEDNEVLMKKILWFLQEAAEVTRKE